MNYMFIKEVYARKIEESRGEDTIEVVVNGCKASAPSGKSTGKFETHPYRKNIDWSIKAITSLNFSDPINSFEDLKHIENSIKIKFDIKDVTHSGANALFALESAILKALAKDKKKELWQIINPKAKKIPVPVGNAVEGGLHAHMKNHPIFQEFLLIPKSKKMKENVKTMNNVYRKLGRIIKSNKLTDEGAWETDFEEEKILQILNKFKKEINIGIDIAASSFYDKKMYRYNDKILSKEEQIDYINELVEKYNLFYVEDPLDEIDFSGFSKEKKKHLIVGDDLTVTHKDRLLRAIKNKSINAMIIKPNQNGSLLQLKEIFNICKKYKIKTIMSHRSGETLDNALADYAFGFGADYIKCGIATPWRIAKLKRLIQIEKDIR